MKFLKIPSIFRFHYRRFELLKMAERKYANRKELLERNPALKKNWWTRTFAVLIVMGALTDPDDWPAVRFFAFFGIALSIIFGTWLVYRPDLPQSDIKLHIFLIALGLGSATLLLPMMYGYSRKGSIDTTGAVKPDNSYLRIQYPPLKWLTIILLITGIIMIIGWLTGVEQ